MAKESPLLLQRKALEIAYAAGLFEGEGWVRVPKKIEKGWAWAAGIAMARASVRGKYGDIIDTIKLS